MSLRCTAGTCDRIATRCPLLAFRASHRTCQLQCAPPQRDVPVTCFALHYHPPTTSPHTLTPRITFTTPPPTFTTTPPPPPPPPPIPPCAKEIRKEQRPPRPAAPPDARPRPATAAAMPVWATSPWATAPPSARGGKPPMQQQHARSKALGRRPSSSSRRRPGASLGDSSTYADHFNERASMEETFPRGASPMYTLSTSKRERGKLLSHTPIGGSVIGP